MSATEEAVAGRALAGRPSESRPDPANADHSRSSYPASATPRLGRAVSSSSAGAAVVVFPATAHDGERLGVRQVHVRSVLGREQAGHGFDQSLGRPRMRP